MRRTIANHLKEAGHSDTAAMVMATPPSGMAAIMDKLDIDAEVLQGMRLPGNHSSDPDISAVVAAYESEALGPQVPGIVAQAEAVRDAAFEELEAAKKRRRNMVARISRNEKKLATKEGIQGTDAFLDQIKKLQELEEEKEKLVAEQKEAKAALDKAEAELLQAKKIADSDKLYKSYTDSVSLSEEERDAFLASLSDEDVEAICKYRELQVSAEIDKALGAGGVASVADRERDTSIYYAGTVKVQDGSSVVEVEGRYLDANTAIVRNGSGDFNVLYKTGESYVVVGAAGSKVQAVAMAEKIPVFTELKPLPKDASEYEQQVWDAKEKAITEAARKAAATPNYGTPTEEAKNDLAKINDSARAKVVDLTVTGPVETDVSDARKRHNRRERERLADEAGMAARKAALSAGASKKDADKAFNDARRKAMGTPTVGGGVIPHFDHKIPPESLGQDGYASLTRSGIRAWGVETASDYAVIKKRAGDVAAWGFGSAGSVKTSSIASLVSRSKPFLDSLDGKEKDALHSYTTGMYTTINAAVTGRDPKPSSGTKTIVSRITSAFDKLKGSKQHKEPMTILRGAKFPSGWKGTREEFLKASFTPGSRMEIGKITSCSTNSSTASGFGSGGYIMAIRSRTGVTVKSLSQYSGENEIVLPMGTQLRCVEVKKSGLGGMPTVYLVEEDLVAEAEEAA